jgi:hypothetical protein
MTMRGNKILKRSAFVLLFSLGVLGSVLAQSESQRPAFWWSLAPAATLPLGLDSNYFSTGVTVGFSGEYVYPPWWGFAPLFRINLNCVPLSVGDVGGLYEIGGALGAAYRIPIFGPFSGRVFADIGYSFVDLVTHVAYSRYFFGNNGFTEGGAGLSYALNPNIALRLDAFYTYSGQLSQLSNI